jgi:hypothetical protein
MKDDYQFTQDWFSWSPPVWKQVFKQLKTKNILEIGCFEGRATAWLIENVDFDEIICIDTFEGGEEHTPETMEGVHERWEHNVDVAVNKVEFAVQYPSHPRLLLSRPHSVVVGGQRDEG